MFSGRARFGTVLFVPVMILVVTSIVLTSLFALRFGERAVDRTARQLEDETAARIVAEVDTYLSEAVEATETIENAIEVGTLDPDAIRSQQRFLCKEMEDRPNLKFLAFADQLGQYVGYERKTERLVYTIIDSTIDPAVQYAGEDYDVDGACNVTELIEGYGPYDARTRGWYSDATGGGADGVWSPTFLSFGPEQFLIVSHSRRIVDTSGEPLGVSTASVSLGSMSEFLAGLSIGTNGEAFIVEASGGLVATSTDDAVWGERPSEADPDRLEPFQRSIFEAEAPLIQSTIADDASRWDDLELDEPRHFVIDTDAGNAFLLLTPYRFGDDISWTIATVIPRSDFLGEIENSRRQALLVSAGLVLATLALSWLFSRWLMRPVNRMVAAADAISHGDHSIEIPESGPTEIGQLAQAFNRMSGQLEGSITQLEHSAFHDPMTDLPNRSALMARAEALSVEGADPYSIVYIDADGFKLINDSLGHHIGDRLLVEMGARIRACTPEEALAARIGGDEFCVLAPSRQMAGQIADDLVVRLKAPYEVEGHRLRLEASIGISTATQSQGGDPAGVLRDADIAMYEAKSRSNTSIAEFDESMRRATIGRMQLKTDLQEALERRQLSVAYQPIVDLATLEVRSFEALLRWHHPVSGEISPVDFIPAAEESGLIGPIGEFVLSEVCAQIAEWAQATDLQRIDHVNVNVSPLQLGLGTLAQQTADALHRHGVAPNTLGLEITESSLVETTGTVSSELHALERLGVPLLIDDFGTGYSALNYLYRYPFSAMKIDRSFIAAGPHGRERRLLTEAMSATAQSLHLSVVAEGIETSEQLEFLRSIRCDRGQGWLFSRALPPDDAIAFARASWRQGAASPAG